MKKVRGTTLILLLFIFSFIIFFYFQEETIVDGMVENKSIVNLSFSGSFIQKWYGKYFTYDRWVEELVLLKQNGVNELIIQNIADTKRKETVYPTKIPGYKSSKNDMIFLALEAAKEVGIKVRIGLGENYEWWSKGPLNGKWLQEEAKINTTIFNEIFELYGSHESLSGWYIPYEFSGLFVITKGQQHNLNKFYKTISKSIRNKSNLDIMISPYYNSKESFIVSLNKWKKAVQYVLQDTNIDIVALQDSIGVNFNTLDNVKDLFYHTKQATDSLGISLYADTETFTMTPTGNTPVSQSEIIERMKSVQPYVDGYVAFSISHYQNTSHKIN